MFSSICDPCSVDLVLSSGERCRVTSANIRGIISPLLFTESLLAPRPTAWGRREHPAGPPCVELARASVVRCWWLAVMIVTAVLSERWPEGRDYELSRKHCGRAVLRLSAAVKHSHWPSASYNHPAKYIVTITFPFTSWSYICALSERCHYYGSVYTASMLFPLLSSTPCTVMHCHCDAALYHLPFSRSSGL
jgi:hypothetical protein